MLCSLQYFQLQVLSPPYLCVTENPIVSGRIGLWRSKASPCILSFIPQLLTDCVHKRNVKILFLMFLPDSGFNHLLWAYCSLSPILKLNTQLFYSTLAFSPKSSTFGKVHHIFMITQNYSLFLVSLSEINVYYFPSVSN